MTESALSGVMQQGMMVILKIGGPLLIASLLVGLLVSLVQAITQINEATLSFVPKVIILGLMLGWLGTFMFTTLATYTLTLFDRLVIVGGS
jgi:flagellar biosynthetic protein FliQ